MKRIIILLTLVFINTKLTFQPEFNHYVIGSRLFDISIVFDSERINAIWVGDRCFCEDLSIYDNL